MVIFYAFMELAALAILTNSIIRFFLSSAWSGNLSENRILAGTSSLVTLLITCILYSEAVTRDWTAAIRTVFGSKWVALQERIFAALDSINSFFFNLNSSIDYHHVSANILHQVSWPLVILGVSYALRLCIYLALERRNLNDAATTGAVYWSHITAYAMLISLAIVVVHWEPLVVLSGSIGIIVVLLIGFQGVFADIFVLLTGFARFSWRIASSGGREIARVSAFIAGTVRLVFSRAHAVYSRHVSDPIRRNTERAVKFSTEVDNRAKQRLIHENDRHRAQFGENRRPARKRRVSSRQ